MTALRLRQVEQVFQAAAACDPADRAAFLQHACIGDPELRAHVEALLAVDGQAGASRSAAVQGEAERLSLGLSTRIVGCRFGLYRVTGVLGHGGMGSVYRAVRDDDVCEKVVALKVLKRG